MEDFQPYFADEWEEDERSLKLLTTRWGPTQMGASEGLKNLVEPELALSSLGLDSDTTGGFFQEPSHSFLLSSLNPPGSSAPLFHHHHHQGFRERLPDTVERQKSLHFSNSLYGASRPLHQQTTPSYGPTRTPTRFLPSAPVVPKSPLESQKKRRRESSERNLTPESGGPSIVPFNQEPPKPPAHEPSIFDVNVARKPHSSPNVVMLNNAGVKYKKRLCTTPEQLSVLEREFNKDPFPSKERKYTIAYMLGISSRQVQVWFQNRRSRAKRQERKRTSCNNNVVRPNGPHSTATSGPTVYPRQGPSRLHQT